MKVHIVDPYQSAAMFRMAYPLVEHLPKLHDVTRSEEADLTADVNIHLPFHSLIGMEDGGGSKHIAVYTHCNAGAEHDVYAACQRADIVTAMSFRGRDELLNMGVDPKKIHVIYCAADEFKYRKRLIGVIGYPQPNGRKRESLILDMAWQYDLSAYEFVFSGVGWEGMVEKLHSLGVSASQHHADTFEKLVMTMRFLDVLLVTGYREGGPLPLLECMAAGVPVLSPDFGYAADLLDEDNIYTSTADLMAKLDKLFEKSIHHHKLLQAWSWTHYAAEYAMLIGELLDCDAGLFPEHGTTRYMQLSKLIDEIKPYSICEIGTWNGNNAIRMIQRATRYRPAEDIFYHGFDLFETQTGEQFTREYSKAGYDERVVRKRIKATGADVELIAGDTRDTIVMLTAADLYFVDGGHSERTIQNDGEAVLTVLPENSVAVFDDYYHSNKPNGVGCNRFIDALDRRTYNVEHLPERTRNAEGIEIGMVKVTHAGIPIHLQAETYTHFIPSV